MAMLEQLSRGLRISNPLRVMFAAALLTVATWALAQQLSEGRPDAYTVQRGDTLWDIAGRFLKRPWLWAEIRRANPQITNPNLIYPGDVISLAYLNRVAQATLRPGPRNAEPINAVPLSEVEGFLHDLRVVDDFKQLPHVVALEDDRLIGAEGQLAYVRGIAQARPGDRYLVVRPTLRFSQTRRVSNGQYLQFKEDLDFRGNSLKGETADMKLHWTNAMLHSRSLEPLGQELTRVNAGTVTRGEVGGAEASTLLLDDPTAEVRPGDRLIPVDAQAYDLQFFPHAPRNALPPGKAQVMAVASSMTSGGPHDVIAISAGSREGVDNGTVFSIWRHGSNTYDQVAARRDIGSHPAVRKRTKVQLPDEYAGHVLVFRTFEKMSYGLVMEGVKPARVGDDLKHPDAAY